MDRGLLEKIANLSHSEIGSTEENVKNNIVIPLLEALGHKGHLDFERSTRSGKIDIFIKNLPAGHNVIFEVKNLGADLTKFIPQLETYSRETAALLAVLTNGDEFYIFDPYWRGRTFDKQLIFAIQRKSLLENLEVLNRILSREALTTESIIEVIESREKEITETERSIKEYDDKIEALEKEIENKKAALETLKKEKELKVDEAYKKIRLQPLASVGVPQSPSMLPPRSRTQKDIIRLFIMGNGTSKRCVTTDEIFEYVRKLPEFQRYREDNIRKNATYKAYQLTKEDPQHFTHPNRNTLCYNPS